ncbi:unnamed protein product [Peniophora sp. CBMAI 1063]|nr:unnamed protein product [Peniophora sp. CBMAI 1063]
MSSTTIPRGRAPSPFFRYRPLGRAPSPPTWACYEQIHAPVYDSDDSDSDGSYDMASDYEDAAEKKSDDEEEDTPIALGGGNDAAAVDNMDVDEDAVDLKMGKTDSKGKGKAVETTNVFRAPRARKERKRPQPVVALRPILTIQRSQGFVWNQDLFVPPYAKDRYIASTSPPQRKGFISSSVDSALNEYEPVEIIEIHVRDGELQDIIP